MTSKATPDSPYLPIQGTMPKDYGSNESGGRSNPENNMAEDSEKQKSFKGLISDFAGTTSMPGVIRIKTSSNLGLRLLWAFGLIAALIACTVHMYKLTTLFVSFPKQTEIQLDFTTLVFPAITICNTNAIRLSKLLNLSESLVQFAHQVNPEELVKNENLNDSLTQEEKDNGDDNIVKNPPDRRKRSAKSRNDQRRPHKKKIGKPRKPVKRKMCRNPRRGGNHPKWIPCWRKRKWKRKKAFLKQLENVNTSRFQEMVENDPQQQRDDQIGPPEASALIMSEYKLLYSKLDAKARLDAGHQLQDLILSCSFRGRDCSGKFTTSQSLDYGNCYTLQSDDFIVDFNGPEEGLSVVLFTEVHEYIPGINNGYGVRVVIHDVNTTTFPTDEGFFVSSETETNIGLRHVNIIRLGKPYGSCTDGKDFVKKYGFKYTRQTCQRFCEVDKMLEKCRCFSRRTEDDYIKINRSSPQNFTACSTSTELNCSFSVEEELRHNKRMSCVECVNACEEKLYARASSQRIWPTEQYMEVLFRGICQKYGENSQFCTDVRNKKTTTRIRGLNFLKMNIYFEDLNYEKIQENPSYEVEQYCSDLGGAIGLWIGLSVVSFIEFGELVLGAVSLLYTKLVNRNYENKHRL